jgi:hypothetical protein
LGGRGYEFVFAQGNTGHDEADSGNPVKIGGKANNSLPTPVSADDDRVDVLCDRYGRIVTISGFPPGIADGTLIGPKTVDLNSTTANVEVVAAPLTAGHSILVYDIFCSNTDATTNTIVSLKDGSTTRISGGVHVTGGGWVWKTPWLLTDQTALNAATLDAVSKVIVNVNFRVVET